VAAAARFIGYEYQHHHIPDWDPPDDWPWKQCCGARHDKGIDCSNFSGWNYNWAFGIHLNTDVHKQAAASTARSAHGELAHGITTGTIPNPYREAYGLPAPGIESTDFSAWVIPSRAFSTS
jgi:hypothetical protein